MPRFVPRNLKSWLAVPIALVLIVATGGCALFDTGLFTAMWQDFSINDHGSTVVPGEKLPVPPTPPNAITLEVMIVERAVGDPLLETRLWDEVEQVGAVAPEVQGVLTEHGFRVGHCSSKPPRALEKLLGLKSEFADEWEKVQSENLLTRRIVLPAGANREIQTSEFYADLSADVPLPAGVRGRAYHNARCVLRIVPRKLQDNWIRVEFLPEIHYGEQLWRPMMIDNSWQARTSQEIEPLYPIKFSVDLNVGEIAVIGGIASQPDDSIGKHFFQVRSDDKWRTQRLLVIRFSDMSRAKSTYAAEAR